jgi:hypothetical protein
MQRYAALSSPACHAMEASQNWAELEPGQCPSPHQPAMQWSACQCSARPVHYVLAWFWLGSGLVQFQLGFAMAPLPLSFFFWNTINK